ncbi:hypothetical protein [Jannaschia ovalis]|uniref:NADH-quinone oxidoreductase subunit E n=1 Tax=Jannaschia ovalis TaxID=3038773 RepID=A0ABY8L8F8_9RHOB|nr:hypothetical protein [Jannaschia sp. GRR-S6-38]WGH77648.1 hypothetical protein P8627_11425 [Jannaschia sp. GRR-S6-38]
MSNQIRPIGTLESTAIAWGVAFLAGAVIFALLLAFGGWTLLQAIFAGLVVAVVLGGILTVSISRPQAAPRGASGTQAPTADLAKADAPGTPGQAARPLAPRNVNAPSPHRTEIPRSIISDVRSDPEVKLSAASKQGQMAMAEAAPATRIPSPAPVNADDPAVARPVGATANPTPQENPTPVHGKVVSPEPPASSADKPRVSRNETATAADGGAAGGPAPSATKAAQSYNEVAPAPAADASAPAAAKGDAGGGGMPAANESVGTKPQTLDGPRAGGADDLKKIKGVGPKLETLLHKLGFYHFDQIAGWSDAEISWVDQHLEGFKGRVRRDDWVSQASKLATGEGTEFSKRVDKGGVY